MQDYHVSAKVFGYDQVVFKVAEFKGYLVQTLDTLSASMNLKWPWAKYKGQTCVSSVAHTHTHKKKKKVQCFTPGVGETVTDKSVLLLCSLT